MSIIESNGHSYDIVTNAKVYRIQIGSSKVYACLGEKDSLSPVGMLFVKREDRSNLEQYLHREYNAEETCSVLPELYVAREIDAKYGEDRINYRDYCLYTFSTDAERFKRCMETGHTTETLESANSDELIQEPLHEVENQEQPISDDTIESTTSSTTNSHKKKIGLVVVSSIILLTIPVGYVIIRSSNQQEGGGSSSDINSTIVITTSTFQKTDDQLSSAINETSESESTIVVTSAPPNLDLDGSGEVNDVDYGKLIEYNLNPNRERTENIKTIYDTLDYDKDGDVDPDEWDKYIRESN